MTVKSPPHVPKRGSVLVLGGGIVGVTTAYSLLQRGYAVTLVERADEVGCHTSLGNAGLLSVGGSQPWNSPHVPMTVLKTMGRTESPFRIRAAAFPAIIPWGLRFLLNCRGTVHAAASRNSAKLVAYGLGRFRETSARERLSFDRQQNGVLKYFQNAGALAQDYRATKQLAAAGVEHRQLDRNEIVALEPTLAPQAESIAGGLYFPGDESGDSSQFAKGLAARCAEMGASILTRTSVHRIDATGERITGVTTSRGTLAADHYILCAGPEAAALAQPLRLSLPIYPVKGYSVTFETDGSILLPNIPLLDWGRKICITRFGKRIRATGFAEFGGYNFDLSPSRLQSLRASLIDLFPSLNSVTEIRNWAGLRPVTPDGLPILGESPFSNLFLNVGHGTQGWGLSSGCAEIVADVVSGRQPEIPLGPYAFRRRSC